MIEVADEHRVVSLLLGVPGGAVLIWGIVRGAAGYVLWRTVKALADPYDFGPGPAGSQSGPVSR